VHGTVAIAPAIACLEASVLARKGCKKLLKMNQVATEASNPRRNQKDKSSGRVSSSGGKLKLPMKIAERFEIEKKLGAGCFGEVYLGKVVEKGVETGDKVAVKFEDCPGNGRPVQLEQEREILRILRNGTTPNPQGFSECFHFGKEGRYYCLVMELLGKSLEDRVGECNGSFNPFTTALIADQLMRRVEYLHSKGIVHRDIKPENFMWGLGPKIHHLYMIDFGLSKRYWDKGHIQIKEKLSLTGTARYASINAHRGLEQSRRDDLEAIGHMLLYFLRSSLPWSGLDAKTKEDKYRKIRQKKEDTPLKELCNGFPIQFEHYLYYARKLEFGERPKYDYCRDLFQQVIAGGNHNKPVEGYELQWLKNLDPENPKLVPLNPWTAPAQPDDGPKKIYFSFGGCFCGSSKAVRD